MAKRADAPVNYYIRIANEKDSWAVSRRSDRQPQRVKFLRPVVGLGIVAAAATCVVMVDCGAAAHCQRRDLFQGHLCPEGGADFPPIAVVDDPVVGICLRKGVADSTHLFCASRRGRAYKQPTNHSPGGSHHERPTLHL